MRLNPFIRCACILSIFFLTIAAGPPGPLPGTATGADLLVLRIQKGIYKYHFKDDDHDCDSCHKNAVSRNFRLKREESELCYGCHSRRDEEKWVHGPIGAGQCSICHDPHGSKTPDFLTRKGDRLCYYCHSEARLGAHSDEKGSKSCAYCHNPHSGDTNLLLRK